VTGAIGRSLTVAGWFEQLAEDGYAILPDVLTAGEVEAARRACADALADPAAASSLIGDGARPHGARNLLRLWPGAVAIARMPQLSGPLRRVLGPGGGLVRGLYFDKPPGDGWALPWHRDTAVAVKAHGRAGRFGKPTVKAGVPHVEAPGELLAGMATARVHLDDMGDENGPLRVLPRSHRTADDEPDDRAAVTIRCRAGAVLLMRPLLLHASGHCAAGHHGHRRVVHLEFAPSPDLPDGYEWHTFVPLHE
jgi:hypothetical protein